MSNDWTYWLNKKLSERAEAGNLRVLHPPLSGIDFWSNDYRGWAHSGLLDHLVGAELGYGTTSFSGSTGSRLISGNYPLILEVEKKIADTHKSEAALIYSSGYQANTGVINALGDRSTIFIADEYCHASMMEAAHGSLHKALYKFKHNDLFDLEKKLKLADGRVIVLIESVYSMDGDQAPMEALVKLCRKHNCRLLIDEAHALGVCGKDGLGLASNPQWNDVVLARVYTYGKAMACHGAAVVGSDLLIRFLTNFSRPFVYSTSPPAHQVWAISKAYDLLLSHSSSLQQLHENIAHFRKKLYHITNGWIDSTTAVQSLVVGNKVVAKDLAVALLDKGFLVKAILYPTVPLGLERLRFSVHAHNTEYEIGMLSETLGGLNI